MSERPDGRATPLEYFLENAPEELKDYIRKLRLENEELRSREIVHLSLRLASINGPTQKVRGQDDKHLGIAVYFIFGPPADMARQASLSQEYGMAFGLSPGKYQDLMAGNEVLIHEVKPENSLLKPGEQFPIEFLTEGEKHGDFQSVEAHVNGDSGPGGDGRSGSDEGSEPGEAVPG